MIKQFKSCSSEAILTIKGHGKNMRISININGIQSAGVTITPDLFPDLLKEFIEVGNKIVMDSKWQN